MSRVPPAQASREARGLTAPVEDYLKAVYELERAGRPAATTDLAERLRVAPASVTGMVRRLAGQGLLTHRRYRGVRLTAPGRLAALRTIRRHRVIEAYLVHALGYRWDEVDVEAERLEHAASDAVVDRMARAIGEPTVDPHGAPIPSREGRVAEAAYRPLVELAAGASADVMQVSDDDPSLLRYLDDLSIRLGSTVRVVDRAPFGGPITLAIGRARRVVGTALAERILVRPRGAPERRARAGAGVRGTAHKREG
ncbi:MAG TPA: metal-dependent transcriptional regulator [Gemmatimonadales bacterium]|nr:metal-dependent transcriptional regulator [Gemmatimonadales bacterium]